MRDQELAIGFAGLATSHPYADAAAVLASHPRARLHVWEPEQIRLADFLRRFPATIVHQDPGALGAGELDGAIVSTRPPEVAQTVAALSASRVPLFINKPAAATAEQLAGVDAVVRPIADRVLSSSVLRFASPVREMAKGLDRGSVLTARATVRHDVSRWLQGTTSWQDDVLTGGGSIVTIGIHGLELLVSLLGEGVEVVSSMASVRHLTGLESEDTAVITARWPDGVLATIDLVGVAANESYSVTVETAAGPLSFDLPADDADPFGYQGAIEGFLTMVLDHRAGRAVRPPVAWSETHAILLGIVTASRLAHPGSFSAAGQLSRH